MGHHPDCKKICISCHIIRTNKKEANNVLKNYIDILKRKEKNAVSPI